MMTTRRLPTIVLALALALALVAPTLAQQAAADEDTLPVTTYVQIKLDEPISLAAMREKYMPGLQWMRSEEGQKAGIRRKYAIRSEDGQTIGGVYLMASMEQVEGFFTDKLKTKLEKKYNAEVEVKHFWTTTMLDNQQGTIVAGDKAVKSAQSPKAMQEGGNQYTVVVQLPRPEPVPLEQAIQSGLSGAPRYADKPGLIRKYFLRSLDGKAIGGVYYFESKQAADKLINADWSDYIKDKTGAEPVIHRYHTPMVVDNVAGALYGS